MAEHEDERDDAFYDAAILEYLAVWKDAPSEEAHHALARERFGLDRNGVGFVNQVLVSASIGTLRNWANSQDDPWWQAACRLAHSERRDVLVPLRRSVGM